MLTLPSKFAEENSKDNNTPALLVAMQSGVLQNDQTTQADWAGNSLNSQVGWTVSPGDVRLATTTPPVEGQATYNEGKSANCYYLWQSFKQNSGAARYMIKVRAVYCHTNSFATNGADLYCKIYAADKTTVLGSCTVNVPYTGAYAGPKYWVDFNFTAPGILLQDDTTYWVRWDCVYVYPSQAHHIYIWFINNSTTSYSKGQFDAVQRNACGDIPGTNIGDAAFEVHFSGDYYYSSGHIRTQTMDLGETPEVAGEWYIEDLRPTGTGISYQAWASDTGAFAGEEVSLGTIQDGDPISVLKRYYRVRADLSATNQSYTPSLQRIKALFEKFDTYADNMSLGCEPSVLDASSLATTIDIFEKSTISQVTITFGLTPKVSDWLASKYPRNKTVKVKAGFAAPSWAAADYIDYFVGIVEDWSLEKNEAKIIVRDYSKSWKTKVPSKWESVLDDVTWTNQHPIDVCLDILRNRINVRDSKFVTSSFDAVKTALAGWKVSRTITKEPVDADDLLHELRLLMSAYFIPQPDGKIRIKRWDANEAAVESLNDDNFMIRDYQGNAPILINQTHIYFGWDGNGNEAADFAEFRAGVDGTSQTNWNEMKLKEIKDKWTLAADVAQIQDLEGKILARYANPPAIIPGDVSRSKIALEVGDIVAVTTKKAPSIDMNGISNVKFQVVNRNLDHKRDTIKLKLLRV